MKKKKNMETETKNLAEEKEKPDRTDEKVFREYMENLDLKPENFEGKILDVGSGEGGFARWAKDHNVRSEIYSIEPSDEIENTPKGTKGHAEKLPFRDGEFDLVISNSAIPNVFIGGDKEDVKKQVKNSLAEFIRIAKAEGEIRLDTVLKGKLYENQRNFSEALDEALDEMQAEHDLTIEQVHTKPDIYEYDDEGNSTRVLAESFLIKIQK